MNRLLEIDALRGLLLVLMVINHTPSPLRTLTNQPLGFVSAAEAFVFVSACLCGLVFGRRLRDGGLPEVR
ncbi:MAG TPA: OpgC domain-containing protein, partial [Candidatus Competibacter sp.]|nr:OpgC domain-containing protein [Candidatus Competibacter sp.]